MLLFVAILLIAINNAIILLVLIVIYRDRVAPTWTPTRESLHRPKSGHSRTSRLLFHNRNVLVGHAKNLVGFLSYILCLNSSLDKEYGLETRRDSSRDRRSRKISHNPTKFGICSVQRSLYLLYPLRRPCKHVVICQ